MAADEKAHYAGLAQLVTAAGQVPATADDIDFVYARGTFASSTSILKLAAQIETLVLGTYLGAIENVQTPELRLPIGQIAANEAQHVGAVAVLAGRDAIGRAFAASLSIDAASAALDSSELTPCRSSSTRQARLRPRSASASTPSVGGTKPDGSESSAIRATAGSCRPPRSTGCAATARARTSAPATASTRS